MRVYLETYGCAQNQGEGSAIARDLSSAGHDILRSPDRADVGILVTCAVIGSTEARMVRRWQALAARVPHVVVTGCLVPLRTGLLTGAGRERTRFVSIRDQLAIRGLLEGWDHAGSSEPAAVPETEPRVDLPVHEEVVLAQGCTSACSYCFSRLARGRLTSVPLARVLADVQAAVGRGAKEIRLTSLDSSCWGVDLPSGKRLPDLLEAVAGLPGSFQVRLGMLSPQSLRPIGDRVLDSLAPSRFYRFLHLPVQSGSDAVLDSMRRGYTVDEFRRWVARARARFPNLTLATDLIVGFPTETERDFESTLALLREVEPEIVNVTRFSARPLTPASRIRTLPPATLKRRSRAVTALRMELARRKLERWIGRDEVGLAVEHGPGTSTVVRLGNYLPVVVSTRLSLGLRFAVRIDGARSTYLVGSARTTVPSAAEPAPLNTGG